MQRVLVPFPARFLEITLALVAIGGISVPALATSQPPRSEVAEAVSTLKNQPQIEPQVPPQLAQFPWNNRLELRRGSSREVERCLERRSRRDRENCLQNLRNSSQNYDRRYDRENWERAERRCLERRSVNDRQNCPRNLRDEYRNDRYNNRSYEGRNNRVLSPQRFPSTLQRLLRGGLRF